MLDLRLMNMRKWKDCAALGAFVAVSMLATPALCVVLGQVDDFQDGTLQGWQGGASPFNVSTGGPDGAGDRYLRLTTSTNGNLGTNHTGHWTGDYMDEEIMSVNMHLNNLGATPLAMRLLVINPSGDYASTNATVLPAASGWVSVEFILDSVEMTQTGGFATLEEVLADVQILVLRHDPDPVGGPGDPNPVTGQLGIDNITALPEPGFLAGLSAGVAMLLALGRRRRARGPQTAASSIAQSATARA